MSLVFSRSRTRRLQILEQTAPEVPKNLKGSIEHFEYSAKVLIALSRAGSEPQKAEREMIERGVPEHEAKELATMGHDSAYAYLRRRRLA